MISISHKTKQFGVFIIKLLIVIAAFYFIYHQLANNSKLDWDKFLDLFKKNQSVAGITFLLFLSFLNRYFEILKWQNLAQEVAVISKMEATKQVLAALTLGVFTPVGIGEYVGKALYFEKKETKKIIFLNLICNGIQVLILGFFGLLSIKPFSWIRELGCARRPSGFQVPAISGAGRTSLGQAHGNFGDD